MFSIYFLVHNVSTLLVSTWRARQIVSPQRIITLATARDSMTTNARLQGSLNEFGLLEVLQMMDFGGMTGAIHLKQLSTERIGIVYFKEGKLAGCSELDPGALTLGDILQQLGMAHSQHVARAFSMQMQDPFGKRIGERLIEMGVISDIQLREALRTKA